jgi:hypothetical protein
MDLLDNKNLDYQLKKSKLNNNNNFDERFMIGNSNSSCNLNDEFKNKNVYNPNTDTVIYSSPKLDLKSNQDLYSNDLIKKTNSNSQLSTFQANPNQCKAIYTTITNSQKATLQLPNRNVNLNLSSSNINTTSNSQSPKIDNFTSKLPPVPRRNSKTNVNSNTNLTSTKNLNSSLKHVAASNSSLSFSSPIFNNNNNNNNQEEYYQNIDVNNSKLKLNKTFTPDINDEIEKQKTQVKLNLNRNANSNYYQKI